MKKKLKVVAIGAHPDDPETGCGGTMALQAKAGHDVVSCYLTRGEAGIEENSAEATAWIRSREAEEACKILGVRSAFIGQIDGACEVNADRYAEVRAFLEEEDPDIILTHWPIDAHRDHQVCSILVYDAWFQLGRKSAFYYFEVMSGQQTQHFRPTCYVDICSVLERKHEACFTHKSQFIEEGYEDDHANMERFRGLEGGCEFAEGFVRHLQSPQMPLVQG